MDRWTDRTMLAGCCVPGSSCTGIENSVAPLLPLPAVVVAVLLTVNAQLVNIHGVEGTLPSNRLLPSDGRQLRIVVGGKAGRVAPTVWIVPAAAGAECVAVRIIPAAAGVTGAECVTRLSGGTSRSCCVERRRFSDARLTEPQLFTPSGCCCWE